MKRADSKIPCVIQRVGHGLTQPFKARKAKTRTLLPVALAAMVILLPGAKAHAFDGVNRQNLQFPPLVVSTVPANGDQNPYGVAFVPFGFPGSNAQPGENTLTVWRLGASKSSD